MSGSSGARGEEYLASESGTLYVLDTDILVQFLLNGGASKNIKAWLDHVGESSCMFSFASAGDLRRFALSCTSSPDAETRRQGHDLIQFFREFTSGKGIRDVQANGAVTDAFADIAHELGDSEHGLSENDIWVAACTRSLTGTPVLVTSQEEKFRRVPGLAVRNWATEVVPSQPRFQKNIK